MHERKSDGVASDRETGRTVTLHPTPVQLNMASARQRIVDAEGALKKAQEALDEAGQKIVEAADKVKAVPEEACPVCARRMEDERVVVVVADGLFGAFCTPFTMRRPVVLPRVGSRGRCPCARRMPGYEIRVCKACRDAFVETVGQWLEGERLIVVSLGSWGDDLSMHMTLPASMDKERRNELMNLVVDWLANTPWRAPVSDK